MSDAKQGRFEIDLDEIERQLRRSAEAAPAPKSDPLAELARIVGQDDPFSGLFADKAAPPHQDAARMPASPSPAAPSAAEPPRTTDVGVSGREDDAALGFQEPAGLAVQPYDPVTDAYGAPENAFEEDDIRPLAPRRSRRGLVAVGASLVVIVLAGAGVLAWRGGSGKLLSTNGTPPIIQADKAPLKVAPENPGGIEIPNQDRQIYQRSAPEPGARVVDRQEQPIDVREAARSLPPAPVPSPPAATVPSSPPAPAGAQTPAAASPPAVAAVRPPRSNAVQTALGEPRRVRTVTVRPDGTVLGGPSIAVADPTLSLLPGSLPPPIQVATVSVTGGDPTPAAASTPAAPADGGATPSANAVSVLPPQRPRLAAADARPVASPAAAPVAEASTPAGFTVQLGVRATEQQARSAFSQAVGKYGTELAGRSPVFAKADVGGKTVYRVRVAAASRADATSLCEKLKTAGAQCYVAAP